MRKDSKHDQAVLYPDTGCEHSPSCLSCPLPLCKYDLPRSYSTRPYTREQIVETQRLLAGGATQAEIARVLGKSTRSVYRWMHLKASVEDVAITVEQV